MGLETLKITTSALEGYRIQDAADRPSGTALDVKKLFDKLFLSFGVPTINAMIDGLVTGGSATVGVTPITGVTGDTVQAVLESLKALVDDCYTDAQTDTLLALKTDKTTTAQLVQSVAFDADSGVFTFTKQGGTTVEIDTALEKVAVNFAYDASTQDLVLTLVDGSTQRVSLAAFVTLTEFVDSDTVDFTTSGQTVTASVKAGSVTLSMLEASVMQTMNAAKTAAQTAQTGAEAARDTAIAAKTAALGAQVAAEGAKDTAVVAKQAAEDARDAALLAKTGAQTAQTGAQTAQTGAQTARDAAMAAQSAAEQAKNECEAIAGGDYVPTSQKGAAGGVATLDDTGKVPSAQLPAMDYDAQGTASAAVSTHNTNEAAHADMRMIIAGKAAVSHSHTPAAVGADATGTASAAVSAHDTSGAAHEDMRIAIAGKAAENHSHTASEVGAAATSHVHSASNITSGTLSVARGGTGVTSMTGTDYTTSRPRGIAVKSSVPTSVNNGCIVCVYDA